MHHKVFGVVETVLEHLLARIVHIVRIVHFLEVLVETHLRIHVSIETIEKPVRAYSEHLEEPVAMEDQEQL